jgi:uncharacterized repeat protein (TIGR01451 family)
LSDDVSANISWAGPDLSLSTKTVNRATAQGGDVLTYTVTLVNSGVDDSGVTLTDAIPSGTSYLTGSAYVSPPLGLLDDGSGIRWSGTLSDVAVNVVFAVQVAVTQPAAIVNTALINDGFAILSREALTVVNGYEVFLPLILRQW